MAPPRGKVAFITGANGITGNAIVENLIRKPESEWSKIIITSRRTPTHNFWQDHRVRFIALDFLRPVEELIEKMAPLCHDVTHAFFASYVHTADFTKLRESNIPLFHNFLVAIDIVAASSLQRVCLQTGGKPFEPLTKLRPIGRDTPTLVNEKPDQHRQVSANTWLDRKGSMDSHVLGICQLVSN
ncbi:hypothetical protein CEP53_012842 [Fusarium sp. AF-6]|nr:hypothetical protein CEP53_012842 [Fusarium sp. AF-6]